MRTSLLVFICFGILLSLTANAAPDAVLDNAYEEVQAGVEYYILPVAYGRGGGLTVAGRNNNSCPLGVIQEPLDVFSGLPVMFTPVDDTQSIIRVSTDLNIKFSLMSICIESNVWKLDEYDETTKQWFVRINGVEGNPGSETISNWFKIEKYEDDYKLVFCPTVCDFCEVICRDIGIFIEDDKRRLALSDVPLRVVFKKAYALVHPSLILFLLK